MKHLTALDIAVFVAYLLATVAVGMYHSRGGRSLSDYFLAGKKVNPFVVALTVIAALFSGISYLAAPGEVYSNGLGFGLIILSFFIATPITAIAILPSLCNGRYFTAYEYFQERFGLPMRLAASGLFILRVSLWLGAAIYAPALALQAVTGLPLYVTILCTGLLSTAYTIKGGMKAVIWTDVLQLAVLFGGQLMIVYTAVKLVPGGFEGVLKTAQDGHRLNVSLSLDPRTRITLWSVMIGGTFLNLVQMATDQVSVQRYLTAGSLRDAQRSLWIKLWIFLPIFGIFYGTGLVLYAFYQAHGAPVLERPDQILPHFVVTQLPQGLPGLLIAAIYAASMSTVSAGVNSLTSATICDFYKTLGNQDEATLLRRSKWWTLFYGLLVTGMAFVIASMSNKTLVESVNTVIGLVGGPMLGLFFLGIYDRGAHQRGALIGAFIGLSVSIFFAFYKSPASPGAEPTVLVSFLWLSMIGCVVTFVVGSLISRVIRQN